MAYYMFKSTCVYMLYSSVQDGILHVQVYMCIHVIQFNSRWHTTCSNLHVYTCYTVQFKMAYYMFKSTCSEKPICAPSRLSEVSLTLRLKQFQCSSDWQWPFLILSRKIVRCFLFPCPSPPGDQWCDVLGFVPAGIVSNSSSLRCSLKQSTCKGCFARQCICLVSTNFSPISKKTTSAIPFSQPIEQDAALRELRLFCYIL